MLQQDAGSGVSAYPLFVHYFVATKGEQGTATMERLLAYQASLFRAAVYLAIDGGQHETAMAMLSIGDVPTPLPKDVPKEALVSEQYGSWVTGDGAISHTPLRLTSSTEFERCNAQREFAGIVSTPVAQLRRRTVAQLLTQGWVNARAGDPRVA